MFKCRVTNDGLNWRDWAVETAISAIIGAAENTDHAATLTADLIRGKKVQADTLVFELNLIPDAVRSSYVDD